MWPAQSCAGVVRILNFIFILFLKKSLILYCLGACFSVLTRKWGSKWQGVGRKNRGRAGDEGTREGKGGGFVYMHDWMKASYGTFTHIIIFTLLLILLLVRENGDCRKF